MLCWGAPLLIVAVLLAGGVGALAGAAVAALPGAIGAERLRASLDATLAGSPVSREESRPGSYQPIR